MDNPLPPLDGTGVDDRVMLFRVLVLLGIRLRSRMDRRLAGVGLTTQQAAVLTVAEGLDPAPSIADVARALGTTHQNTRQLVDSLARKGLIEVRPDPADRRVRRVVPTTAVAELFGPREESDRAAVREWTAALDDEEVRVALDLLAQLLQEEETTPGGRAGPNGY